MVFAYPVITKICLSENTLEKFITLILFIYTTFENIKDTKPRNLKILETNFAKKHSWTL